MEAVPAHATRPAWAGVDAFARALVAATLLGAGLAVILEGWPALRPADGLAWAVLVSTLALGGALGVAGVGYARGHPTLHWCAPTFAAWSAAIALQVSASEGSLPWLPLATASLYVAAWGLWLAGRRAMGAYVALATALVDVAVTFGLGGPMALVHPTQLMTWTAIPLTVGAVLVLGVRGHDAAAVRVAALASVAVGAFYAVDALGVLAGEFAASAGLADLTVLAWSCFFVAGALAAAWGILTLAQRARRPLAAS